jgi:hypothetical protein
MGKLNLGRGKVYLKSEKDNLVLVKFVETILIRSTKGKIKSRS